MALRGVEQSAHLAGTRQRDGVDAAVGHFLDRLDDVGLRRLRIVDVGQYRIDLGALRGDGVDQRAVIALGIELQPEAVLLEIDPLQHLGDSLRRRGLGRDMRLEADLAQRASGLGAASETARRTERLDERLIEADTRCDLHQPAQAFAGRQHQIVERLVDAAPDPGFDRCRIGGVVDDEHRTLQHVGALLGEQPGELGFFPGFEDEDAITVEFVRHNLGPSAMIPVCQPALLRRHYSYCGLCGDWRKGAAVLEHCRLIP